MIDGIKSSHNQKDTKHTILKVAAELFARDGYYKVSVREICYAAGVSKPVLYYYFQDKEALLEALMIETNFHINELKEKYFSENLPFEEFLNTIVNLYVEFVENFPHLVKFSALIQAVNVPQKIRDMKLNRYRQEMSELISYIKQGQKLGAINSRHDARLLVQNLIGNIILIVVESIILENNVSELRSKLNSFAEFWKDSFIIKTTGTNL